MSRVLSFTLPVPPSANRYWRNWRGRTVISAEAKTFKAAAKVLAHKQGARPLAGDVRVTVQWFRARKSGDVDNRAKVVLDALQGIAYADDAQVADFRIIRHDTDRGRARIDVVVQPLEPPLVRPLDI